jgi:hypothetical protein
MKWADNKTNAIELSWIAGLIDGEGSFSISLGAKERKSNGKIYVKFFPRLSINLKYGGNVLFDLEEKLGGHTIKNKKGFTIWSMSKQGELTEVVPKLIPYLKIKREIATSFLEAVSLFPGTPGFIGNRGWNLQNIEKVIDLSMQLNPTSKVGNINKQQLLVSLAESGY